MELKHYKRLSAKYSVDIVSADGVSNSFYQFDTNSLKKAETKFDEYVKSEAFPQETVQLWSRLKSDNDIELVKETKGTLVLEYEEKNLDKTENSALNIGIVSSSAFFEDAFERFKKFEPVKVTKALKNEFNRYITERIIKDDIWFWSAECQALVTCYKFKRTS